MKYFFDLFSNSCNRNWTAKKPEGRQKKKKKVFDIILDFKKGTTGVRNGEGYSPISRIKPIVKSFSDQFLKSHDRNLTKRGT